MTKIYISADIEGITGTVHWDETDKQKADYTEFREQMTAEVAAACQAALQAGATELWVKDAHDSARNLLAAQLPEQVRLVRGWSGHPFGMMECLDESFQAVLMIGYHSRAGSTASPLAHTMTGSAATLRINDRYASEFVINTYTAALVNVPVVFVSGDAGLCDEATALVPHITTLAVKQGIGNAAINIHPHLAVERILAGVQAALRGDVSLCRLELPQRFSVEIRYKDQARAYGASFFPGASLKDSHTLQFQAEDYLDVLKLIAFVL
jgi:D-amino peptidase